MDQQSFAEIKPIFDQMQDRTIANTADFTRLFQILIDHKDLGKEKTQHASEIEDLRYENYYINAISKNFTEFSDLLNKLEGLEAHRIKD